MKKFKMLKNSLIIFYSLLAFFIVLAYILGTVLTVKTNNEYIIISVLIGSFVCIPLFVILFNKFVFSPLRKDTIIQTFNEANHEGLTYTRKKEVSYEALDILSMSNLANEFYISSVIDGVYKGVELSSYFLEYTFDGKRKNEIVSRFYIFKFDKELTKIYKREDFRSSLLKSEKVKVKVLGNKLYLVYSNPKKMYKYHLEPLAFASYEEYKQRFAQEMNLIDNVIETVNKEFK